MDESGYKFKAKNGKLTNLRCHGCHEGSEEKWLVYPRRSHIERFSGTSVKNCTNKTILWHRRLLHLSDRGLKELHKHDLLCGDNINNIDFC